MNLDSIKFINDQVVVELLPPLEENFEENFEKILNGF